MTDYKETLNLPKTNFSMRANLPENELKILDQWKKMNLYNLIRLNKNGKKKFILHDGPPYANEKIHIGHAVNKILKDIVIKSKSLSGFDTPYLPGWDCHGLPIEHKVEKILGNLKNKTSLYAFQEKCRKYAMTQVKNQKNDFIRMGILADWENSYLTMNSDIESNILLLFSKVIKNNHLVRGCKPVYWCFSCLSSLAESEVEYYNKLSDSVYLFFPGVNIENIYKKFLINSLKLPIFAVIWTTTLWTLPANRAIAVHKNLKYQLVKFSDKCLILEKSILEKLIKKIKINEYVVIGECYGVDLEFLRFYHPFMKYDVPIILSQYVNRNFGTGMVHIAPDHGQEDYIISKKYNLSTVNLVCPNGYYINGIHPNLDGVFVLKANKLIMKILNSNNLILYKENIEHSYPFCWRHKKPVIFRATNQWFISMTNNNLKKKVLKSIENVNWISKNGKKKIKLMIKNRPDWCISRQRSWGVPMSLFVHKKTKKIHPNTVNIIKKIAKYIKKFGIQFWWKLDVNFFLEKKDFNMYEKEFSILDVWFDSGSTYYSVESVRNQTIKDTVDIYLEGIDQYRGWFMSSLILSVATENKVPYKSVLSHGFVVDEKGLKMSKSVGNIVSPQQIMKKFGADILRLWVASNNYSNEMSISNEILKRITDIYRKIRNTIRFLLANLNDFDFYLHKVKIKEMVLLDKWILLRAKNVQKKIRKFYDNYDFCSVIQCLMKFCSVDLGSFYLDIIKDRQYTLKKSSLSRRSSQTAMFYIIEILVRLISPILSFTASEIWDFFPGKKSKSIFFEEYYQGLDKFNIQKYIDINFWEKILLIKNEINKFLEIFRLKKNVLNTLEAEIFLYVEKDLFKVIKILENELKFLFLSSDVKVKKIDCAPLNAKDSTIEGLKIFLKKSEGEKCPRCWNYTKEILSSSKYEKLCRRCIKNIYGSGEVRKFF